MSEAAAVMSETPDIVIFARLILATLPHPKRGKRFDVVMPRGHNSSCGISCLDIQIRMRTHHRLNWTYERVRAVVLELEKKGVVQLTHKGYRLADVDAATSIAKGLVADRVQDDAEEVQA